MAESGGAGSKRKAPERPVTAEDVKEWLASVIELGQVGKVSAEAKESILAKIEEHEVDYEVLGQLKEQDLQDTLGMTVLGQRKKLMTRIKELEEMKPPPPCPAGAAGASAAASPGGQAIQQQQPRSVEIVEEQEGEGGHVALGGSSSSMQPSDVVDDDDKAGGQEEHERDKGWGRRRGDGGGSSSKGGGDVVLVGDDAQGEAVTVEKRRKAGSLKLTRDIEDKMKAEDFAVNEAEWVTKELLKKLRQSQKWAIQDVKDSMIKELEDIQRNMKMPGCSVVTVGDTGAGKSTLLNALLGETNVLPTNGMRACTAAIIEMQYNKEEEGKPYLGEVEFVSKEDWDDEFTQLLADLTQQDGKAITREPARDAHNYPSWCKMYAVFGTDYTNSQIERSNPTIEQLRRRLTFSNTVTRMCGKTVTVSADQPGHFRKQLEKFMDSTNDVSSGQFWPLVKRVRMKGRGWTLLKTGCTLVDAPGVRDDNPARDKIVKEYLREADNVWIVANIKRAVNDKTAKNMLGESFRRQLLMDGQYGQVVFVATQSDVLIQSEILKNLGLDRDSSKAECGRARNAFTRERLKNDFSQGIEEMAGHANGVVDAEELRSRYGDLPVFCVSAVDYQKLVGVRNNDGDTAVWDDVDDTEIPQLQSYLHEKVLEKRKANAKASITGLINFSQHLEAFLTDAGDKGGGDKAEKKRIQQAAKVAFEGGTSGLRALINQHLATLGASMGDRFSRNIKPQLEAGAKEASSRCLQLVESWSAGPTKMHWATYGATVRRNGVFRMNFNEALAQDIFRLISTVWENVFVSEVQKDVGVAVAAIEADFIRSHEAVVMSMETAGVALARLEPIKGPQIRSVKAKLQAAMDSAKRVSNDRQKELSRTITPKVQELMVPGYILGTAERGIGSHMRRVGHIHRHVAAIKDRMFVESIDPVLQGLPLLKDDVVKMMAAASNERMSAMRVAYSSMWEEAASNDEAQKAKRSLYNHLADKGMLTQGVHCMDKLNRAYGVQVAVDDDDIEMVEEPDKGEEVKITLDSDDEDFSEPIVPPPGSVRVKPEPK